MGSKSKKLAKKQLSSWWIILAALAVVFLAAQISFRQVVKRVFTEQHRQILNRELDDINLQVAWAKVIGNWRFQVEMENVQVFDARTQELILGPAHARMDIGFGNLWRALTGKAMNIPVHSTDLQKSWRIHGQVDLALSALLGSQGRTQIGMKWQNLPLELIKVAFVDDFVRRHRELSDVKFRGNWAGSALFVLQGYRIQQGKAELNLQQLRARVPKITSRDLSFADADVALIFQDERWAFERPLQLRATEADITLTIKKDLASDEASFSHLISLPDRRP